MILQGAKGLHMIMKRQEEAVDLRRYKFDNIRFILIFLVVFCHLAENIPRNEYLNWFYRVVYSFHIPAFFFLAGYFARFNKEKIFLNLMYPYVLFQTIYRWFDAAFLTEQPFDYNYTTPYWVLWFLFVLIAYNVLIPMLDTDERNLQVMITVGAFACSILAGRDVSIGVYMALSRFFTFIPFFVTGFYAGKNKITFQPREKLSLGRTVGIRIFSLLTVIAAIWYIRHYEITELMLWGSSSYAHGEYTYYIKMCLQFIACLWIIFLLLYVPDKKIPVISELGKHTFWIFILHGFVVKLIGKYRIFTHYGLKTDLLLAVLIALGLIIVLGNRYCSKLFDMIFTGQWMKGLKKALRL